MTPGTAQLSQGLRTGLGCALFVVLAAGAGALRASSQALRPSPVETELDIPPMPASVAAPLAFGFRSLLADFTMLEAIQLLPLRKSSLPSTATVGLDRQMQRLMMYSVDVDAKFAGAYRFAALALPHETVDGKAMGVLSAVEILEQGVSERPDDWHIPFLLGFLQSYYLRDYAAAGRNLAQAAADPGAPRYLGLLATRVNAAGGKLETALALAKEMLAQANEEETRRQWAERVDALQTEKDLQNLDAAAARFRESHGRFPSSLEELVAAGILPEVPQEPHGGSYLLRPDGTAASTRMERLQVYGGFAHLEVH